MNVIGNVRGFATCAKVTAAVRVAHQGTVRIITMDRPAQKNSMNAQMWQGLTGAIAEAEADNSTNIIAIRGNENIFCSGLDLHEYRDSISFIDSYAKNSAAYLRKFAASLIDCKKPIVALVQGHAVGIGVTLLPLCDIVYTSDTATFTTPFARLGIVAECCSSYTFPKIMGYAKASALLLHNQTINAEQAHEWGLVSQVIPFKDFDIETTTRVNQLAKLPAKALLYSKNLVRERERPILHQVNEMEAQGIEKFIQSPETIAAVTKFLDKKNKS